MKTKLETQTDKEVLAIIKSQPYMKYRDLLKYLYICGIQKGLEMSLSDDHERQTTKQR